MKAEEARIWIARLIRGKSEKASIKFPQPGLTIEPTINGTVNQAHAANVSTLRIKFNAAHNGKKLKEGQFISVIHAGQRYLYQVTADTTIVLTATVYEAVTPIQPAIRVALSTADVVEVLTPTLEGYVQGDDLGWSIDQAKIFGLQFDIEEAG
jgi:hypothetical protein